MDDITVAPGVTRTDCRWGYILRGSKEALIASGLAEQHWFSDGTVRDKRGVKRINSLILAGRNIVTYAPKSNRCHVSFDYTAAEKALRERKALADPDYLREKVDRQFMGRGIALVGVAFNLCESSERAWTFSPRVRARAMELCRELTLLFRDSELVTLPAGVTKGDAHFQRFMQSAMMKPQETDGERPRQ